MENRPDFYVLLGVEPTASLRDIQLAYRRRVQVIHPDRFDQAVMPDAWSQANRMLVELNAAYSTLSDPHRRRAYDQLHTGPSVTPTGTAARPSSKPAAPNPPVDTPPGAKFGISLRTIAALLISGLLVLWGVSQTVIEEKAVDQLFLAPPESRRSPVLSTNQTVVRPEPELVGCEPGTEATELPASGTVWRSDDQPPLAPLEVRTRGTEQHLVKLQRDGTTAAMILVRANATEETRMPLGTYSLKYASGKGDYWCGETARFPFGRQTSFHSARETFSFVQKAGGYSGYVLELFLQSNGNLATSRVSPADW